ncbi:hypothetical protein [Streptomyces vietnamensis]|uniref:Uncharacterized protein n=1 Tax=Streptomyces vietnamensis TaxID=362257 RepID=A0A0B5HXE3_9ACTN|nr:hypothetical protein [Streptomyces vietnamensis]AJF65091.1 hypothetical protein SVTN_12350 [Streptomyces vietnamensis]
MDVDAHLLDSVALPGGRELVHGRPFELRGTGLHRALLLHGADLEVHELEALFAGDRAPDVVFPLPWPGWGGGTHSVHPDLAFAAFSGQRSVRAVRADGTTRWVYEHACWDQAVGHPHTGDERQICGGIESGSCQVSDDGRFVWAHVVLEAGDDPDDYLEGWVVLDAEDGRELARLPLPDSVASGSWHLTHPDGVHMGLCVGMGQDGVLVYWGRWDGRQLTVHDGLNEGLDRILFDVHPDHAGFLTVEHYGNDLQLHALDGTVLAENEDVRWDHCCGFLDGDTVIATTRIEYDSDPEAHGTWLLDARTLERRGRVRYPSGPADGSVRPLGDGTWLTYDATADTVHRWTA